jgi:hypothetical protein
MSSESTQRSFIIGAWLFLAAIGTSHTQWLLQTHWGLAQIRDLFFLASFLPLAFGASTILTSHLKWQLLLSGSLLTCLIVVAYVVNRFVYDISPDTLTSHYELTRSIADGANPYFDSSIEGSLDEYSVLGVTFHMLSAIGFNLGITRSPFILTYLHMVLLSFVAVSLLIKKFAIWRNPTVAALIAILSLSAVAQQVLTGYRDGYYGLALVTCVTIILLGWSYRERSITTLLLALVFSAYLPSIKLSLVPIALLLTATCAVGITSQCGMKFWFSRGGLTVLGVAALMWIFPTAFAIVTSNETSTSLLSRESIGATWAGTSLQVTDMGITESFLTLLFAIVEGNPPSITWSLPFQVPSFGEVLQSGMPDTRVSGFGPWFGEAFVLSTVLLGVMLAAELRRFKQLRQQGLLSETPHQLQVPRLNHWLCVILIGELAVSFLLMPFRFNARYVVHLQILLLLILLVTSTRPQIGAPWQNIRTLTYRVAVLFLILNSLICWYGAASAAHDNRRLVIALIDNYMDRVDADGRKDQPNEFYIFTNGKWGISRLIPSQSPGGRDVLFWLSCNSETQEVVHRLSSDIGICRHNGGSTPLNDS